NIVFGADDVGLHFLIGGIGGERAGGGHGAFIECALGAVAIVAAVAEENGALLAHGIVSAIHARAVEHDLQCAGLRIAAHGSPMMRLAFGHGGDEAPGDVREAGAEFGAVGVDATDEIVFLIGHDPRAGRVAVIPAGGVAVVSGLHGAVAVVAAVS